MDNTQLRSAGDTSLHYSTMLCPNTPEAYNFENVHRLLVFFPSFSRITGSKFVTQNCDFGFQIQPELIFLCK